MSACPICHENGTPKGEITLYQTNQIFECPSCGSTWIQPKYVNGEARKPILAANR